jgi:hypothetical protein
MKLDSDLFLFCCVYSFQAVLYLTVRIEKEGCRQSVLVREIGAWTEQCQGSGGGGNRQGTTMTRGAPTSMMLSMDNDSSAGLYTPIFMTDDSSLTVDHDTNINNDNIIINIDNNKALVARNNDLNV